MNEEDYLTKDRRWLNLVHLRFVKLQNDVTMYNVDVMVCMLDLFSLVLFFLILGVQLCPF